MDHHSTSRREFMTTVAAAGLASPLLLDRAVRAASANDRLTLGFIGVGTMGRGHLGNFVRQPDVQVVAICDVVEERRASALKQVADQASRQPKGTARTKGCTLYHDFRELLDRKDIDAVVIATPDHWHAIPCVLAARAGKHIYCEKPLTHNIAEGRAVVQAVKQAGITFQTGSQQRSEFGGKFRLACQLVRSGKLGTIKTVRIGVGDPAVPCNLPEQEVPAGTDWEFWLGPAPKRGYHEELCPKGVHNHFPAWRRYSEYAGGGLADMGAHHFDIAQWALDMDNSGPVKIEPPSDPKEKKGLKYTYANGVEMFHGGPSGCTFEGTSGTLYVDRSIIKSTPEDLLTDTDALKKVTVYQSTDHRRNWLECIRSHKEPICPPEVGHRSASICHLGNIGYWVRRPLRWDPVKERFDDEEANKYLSRVPRQPWNNVIAVPG